MKSISLVTPGGHVRAGWFAGASREAIVEAVRKAAKLPAASDFHLESPDGIIVALDDSIPDGTELRVVTTAAADSSQPAQEVIPVPGPKGYPIVGNLPDLRHPDGTMAAIRALHHEYGDIIKFHAAGHTLYFCADADIITQMREHPDIFPKLVEGKGGLANLSENGVGRGLFTSSDNDPLWHQAHRILMPAFSATALKNYYQRILAVADDLFEYLDALKPGESFLATDIMTQMTFEAIAYAAFNKRYGAIGKSEMPPFIAAMNVVLSDAMEEPRRILPEAFYREAREKRSAANEVMHEEVQSLIRDRRAAMARGEAVPADILQIMLTTPDRITGLVLPDENIGAQLITFLVAGHETTSGLLSYTLYHLWKNPEVQEKLIAEADTVLGRDYSYRPTYEDCARLEYTQRVLKEALRRNPTAPAFTRAITRDVVVGGRYQLHAGERIYASLDTLHHNPKYWGPNAEVFNPDNFLPEAEAARHPDAYHPFGMGMRACIGFQFALLEAKMVLARFAQRYLARPKDPNYTLKTRQALTVKPDHLEMVLSRRPEIKGKFPAKIVEAKTEVITTLPGHLPMSVLYGSNMGTSRDIALALAQEAGKRGFTATVRELDEQVGQPWLTEGPVVIVTSTYNGTPPDNAAKFAEYLTSAPASACQGVRFAVLGCGNKQWKQTFQKFPRLIHDRLQELGATSFCDAGAADADGDFESAVESWKADLWKALTSLAPAAPQPETEDEASPTVKVDVVNFAGAGAGAVAPTRTKLDENSFVTTIRVNRELQLPGAPTSTRHIEVSLPESVSYLAGDHLGVFPHNPADSVDKVAALCGVTPSTVVMLSPLQPHLDGAGGLPLGVPIPVGELLATHVDLMGPVTRRELRAWARRADCPPDKVKIEQWLANFAQAIGEARPTMTDLLEQLPSLRLDLATLLALRPPLKPRYYSISSSPRLAPDFCSITVGVQHFLSGEKEREGLCSGYLATCPEGSDLRVVVRDTGSAFRLPADPAAPVILVGPGTGLAPMRGFLQERHALRTSGTTVGPTCLFFGCRGDYDYIYREELETYAREGTLDVLDVAFSRRPGQQKVYVQELIRQRADVIREWIAKGGSILVCGNARGMAPAVHEALTEILGAETVASLEHDGRYLQDVWASAV